MGVLPTPTIRGNLFYQTTPRFSEQPMSPKILLTGAGGLIGKEAIAPLLTAGFDVHALYAHHLPTLPTGAGATAIRADLFDDAAVAAMMARIQPEYLLHFAGDTKAGYLASADNPRWRDAGLRLLREFQRHGGRRAIFAGTCFEYEFLPAPLKENDALKPTTLYARCKNELRERAEIFARENNLSFGWGRIFYVIGHGESTQRLLPRVVNLGAGEKILIAAKLQRDYLYSKDAAAAFVKFLQSGAEGAVNICRGEPLFIGDLARQIAARAGTLAGLEYNDEIGEQPPVIVGDISRLRDEIGFTPRWTIASALDEIIRPVSPSV
jgi:nucleoside-diphosphate-sugar epimerase